MPSAYKIVFHVMDLIGPQNACIGLGQILLQRGHTVIFLVNGQFSGKFTKYGFREVPLQEDPQRLQASAGESAIEHAAEMIQQTGMMANVSSLEKMKAMAKVDFFQTIYEKARDFEPQIRAFLEAERPNLLIIDSYIAAPSLFHSGIPWVYLFCSNPLGLFNHPDLPPFTSGYAIDSDRKLWREFRAAQEKYHFAQILRLQRDLDTLFGYPPNEVQTFTPNSPYLNVYQFAAELDYDDVIDLPGHFLRVDAFCREEAEPFVLPEAFTSKMKPGDKLIYLSMGSMGSIDVPLMKRLVSVLAKTPHYYIVSKGLLAEQYELPENMWGQAFLPQTQILPLVDLAIIHGGNNSLLEAMANGKPLIVMPIFYDQQDNGQRVEEKGYGVKVNPHCFTEAELTGAVDRLLADKEMAEKYRRMARRIKESNSKLKAALRMEKLIEAHS